MHALWIVLIGVAIVVGGVLALRLHAFLALLLAALVVAALTPEAALQRFAVLDEGSSIVRAGSEGNSAIVAPWPKPWEAAAGDRLLIVARDSQSGLFQQVGEAEVDRIVKAEGTNKKFVHAHRTSEAQLDLAELAKPQLIVPSDYRAAGKPGSFVGRVAKEFGNTAAKIAIVIAMASIIGKCLLDSGAADRIVRSSLKAVGERAAPVAFVFSGFLLAIPVFFDTVFFLMIPLGKAMRMRTGRNYLLYVLSIVAGGTMAHSLVPPTPGPLFVAEELGVELGTMILAGCILGVFTAGSGFLFAAWLNARWDLPLRASAEVSLEELEQLARRDDRELPPLMVSLLPILLPVVLIGGQAIVKEAGLGKEDWAVAATRALAILGNANIALIIAAAIALVLLAWQKRTSRSELSRAVGAA